MNFKTRLTLLFVGSFLTVLTAILGFIYVSYADFRREEFFERLREKGFTTVKLLAEVEQVDKEVLKLIDKNTINEMYDEKILVFNEKNELVYSSLDDEAIPYSASLIDQIRNNQEKFYVDEDGDEVIGVHYNKNNHDYVVLASAYDRYGISKLQNLRNLIIGAMIAGTLLIALVSYFYIRQVFKPIEHLNLSIQNISENNLHEFVAVKNNRDELDQLAQNYNQMLDRLFKAFESQRSFVRNASHELKTPLAIILGKLEKLNDLQNDKAASQAIINSLMIDVEGQSNLVESLLLMQRLQSQMPIPKSPVRLDELLEDSIKESRERFSDLHVEVDFKSSISNEKHLTVMANAMLIKTCFKNLIINAALYSPTPVVRIDIKAEDANVEVCFSNEGPEPLPSTKIFQPFFRQPANQEVPGSGLGLSLIAQIVTQLNGNIQYNFNSFQHQFTIVLPHE